MVKKHFQVKFIFSVLIALILAQTGVVYADEASNVNSGDTAWMLISTALVMLMTPGLALFYGGMVRRKNVLGTIMQSFIALGVVSIIWVLYGYSLAFGPDTGHVIGSFDWVGLKGVGLEPYRNYSPAIPHQAFMIFQMMFAVITPALITGAFAERVKFSAYLMFLILWTTFVYLPLAHWVWGVGGWLRNLGVLDFAGGIVVHLSSGVAALVAAIVVGKRRGHGAEPMLPHNLTMTLLGTALLWFGWFGFNGGSAVASGSLATSAFVVTHIASATATLSWMLAEWKHRGKPTVLGAASGAIAGLATITPASGFVSPMAAVIIGFTAGLACYSVVNLKGRFGYDDSLDVVGIHGVGGILGTLSVGLFATKFINPAGADGLFFGNPTLLFIQAKAVLAVVVFVGVVTFVILKLIDRTIGLRVDEQAEFVGLDHALHGESGYMS